MKTACSFFLSALIVTMTGCGAGTGPGSTSAAVRFGSARISELKQSVVRQDENGKWCKIAKEIRNAHPGFESGTFKGLRALVSYEYRDLKTEAFDRKEDAESAEPRVGSGQWRKVREVYVFKDGYWNILIDE